MVAMNFTEITDEWTQVALQLKHNLIEIARWLLSMTIEMSRIDSVDYALFQNKQHFQSPEKNIYSKWLWSLFKWLPSIVNPSVQSMVFYQL